MSAPPVFPTLRGQGWSVHKKPTFANIVASHVSGREVRAALYQNPIWQFELAFDCLDGTTSGGADPACIASGVMQNAWLPGARTGPPAAMP